ncbi:MAG TPA: hypothetical protein PK360_03510, partial [bacterium]|nr:hypothetical protein [bacterium]
MMIREKAGESNSIHYSIQMVSRPGIASATPEYKGEIHWRNTTDGISYQSGIQDPEGNDVIFNDEPVYFRISRIVPGDWLLSEWSKDGIQWQAEAHGLGHGEEA